MRTLGRVRPAATCKAKIQRILKKTSVELYGMNGITRKCCIDLSKEFLDAAVGRRGNLGRHEILYELPHVNILMKLQMYMVQ